MKLDAIHKSILSRIPSLQDLVSAAAMFQIGKPSVIYPEEGGQIILHPIRGRTPRIDANKYTELTQAAMDNDDLDILADGLRSMGFELFGEADGGKIGRDVNPKLQTTVKQASGSVPKPGNKEVGGEAGMSTGGLGAVKRHKTGTPDHVEFDVEYDPANIAHDPMDALDDIDDTFVFHTHPKMADNNYFPGKMQPR
jgi:hypothetical protein